MQVRKNYSLLFFLFFQISIFNLYAGTTGKIAGRVMEAETGEGIAGANVYLEGTTLGAATDLNGEFVILNISPGSYTIVSSMIGYREQKIQNVKVSIDFTTKIEFKINPAVMELEDAIIVQAGREMVRKDLTSTAAVVGSEEIAAMPVEEFDQILQLQTGVIKGADGDIHIRGGRSSEISYLVNGVSVTDPFSGKIAIEVENTGIQEIQVISGTFNAEYGQAMSGVVEVVTKEGKKDFSGHVSLYSGDYLSSNSETFGEIDNFEPFSLSNIQLNLSGPIPFTNGKLTFFTTARLYENDGWLYGKRIFNTTDSSSFQSPDPADWYIENTGDNAFVPMNAYNKITTQTKLTYKFANNLKLHYEFLWDDIEFGQYNHAFKYNPDGNYKNFKNAYTHLLNLNHTLNSKMFYTVKLSQALYDFEKFVYEDPLDSRYVDPRLLRGSFRTGGTAEMDHFYRSTKSQTAKFDFTQQLTKTHLIKSGLEFRKHTLKLHEFEIQIDRSTNWQPKIPEDTVGVLKNNSYTHSPIEISAYIQDKMEFEDLIINAGLRFDYFNPDGKIPKAEYFITSPEGEEIPREGDRDPLIAPKVSAANKYQFSPRMGIAYPITERGVIHFSYGHFFQMPTFEHLYHNSEFEVEFGGLRSLMGNADLKPQQTVIYELGLQQQLTDDIGLDVTGFYKDMRNLLATQIVEHYTATMLYAKYVNRDYGNVRGVTLAIKKRRSNYFSASIDYTFQIAEGNASDPDAVFIDNQSSPPRESEIKVVPLDWDQTHTLNLALIFSDPGSWGVSLLARLGSGLPYSPSFQGIRTSAENSERKPLQLTVDLNAEKELDLFGIRSTVFIKIYNLLDRKNEINVYSDTGKAGYTLSSIFSGDWRNYSTIDDFLNRPDFYSEPRKIIIGMSFGF